MKEPPLAAVCASSARGWELALSKAYSCYFLVYSSRKGHWPIKPNDYRFSKSEDSLIQREYSDESFFPFSPLISNTRNPLSLQLGGGLDLRRDQFLPPTTPISANPRTSVFRNKVSIFINLYLSQNPPVSSV